MPAHLVVVSDARFADIFVRAPGAALRADDPSVQAQNDAPHIVRAIAAAGHDVDAVVVDDVGDVDAVVAARPDLVVNLCDSLGGDPSRAALVVEVLDAAGVAHTGGDAAAVRLGKAKHRVKHALVAAGLPTPRFVVVDVDTADVDAAALAGLVLPVIVKLAGEHASVGIDVGSVCFDVAAVSARVRFLRAHFAPQAIVVEEFVGGREFYVSCIGRPLRALPLMEHHFAALPFRTFDKKWTDRDVDVDARFAAVPLRTSAGAPRYTLDDVHELAAHALDAIGWRDWGRVDLRLDKGGVPLIIDVTPMTYLHPEAPCAKAAAAAGLAYDALWATIVAQALAAP